MNSSKTSSRRDASAHTLDDPYAVLGISRRAGSEEVRRAYFELAKQHSPETDPERFQVIRAAYDALRTDEGRARAGLFLLQPPAPLPTGRRPSYDLDVHPSDLVRLALEIELATLSLRDDFREPSLTDE